MKYAWILVLALASVAFGQKASEEWPYPVGVTTADCAMSVAPSVLLFGKCHLQDGDYITTDAGATWTKFQGAPGTNGISPTVAVGIVRTLPAGSAATVNNSGTG